MTGSASFLTADKTSKILVLAVSTVFAGLIFFQAYLFWQTAGTPEPPDMTAQTRTQMQVKPVADIRQLAATHLFGDTLVTTPQYTEVKEDKSLNLTLRGIVSNRGGNTSLAIIESGPNNEETFAVGDSVFNKGTLNHVADDHVILERSTGQLARLQLPDQNVDETISEEFLPLAQPEALDSVMVEPDAVIEQSVEPEIALEPTVAEQNFEPEIPAEPVEEPLTDNLDNLELPPDDTQDPQQDADPLP